MIRACAADDVPIGEGRALTIDGSRLAVFHTPTGWYAIDDTCPHAGGPLSDGIVGDRTVICPLHERRFDLATGESSSDKERVRCYAVELRDDEVFVEPRPAR